MTTKAIIIDQPGDPEVLQWRDSPVPQPKEKEVLIRQTAAGLNYIDTYHRRGLFGMTQFPAIIGMEGAGVIEAVGPGCELGFSVGQRVAYAGGPVGGYAQYRTLPERWLAKLPDTIPAELAAGFMVKGLTAHYLLRRTFVVDRHATILVHAASGGVGLLLCQWAKHLGATVLGTVSDAAKAQLAAENGCDYPLILGKDDVVAACKKVTDGRGCNVVYDSVGAATYRLSLDSLMPFGMFVSYGEASGPVPPIALSDLQRRGSLFMTRPSLDHYLREHGEYLLATATLLKLVSEGVLKVNIKQSYYLKDAAKAHAELEARNTKGATIFYTEA